MAANKIWNLRYVAGNPKIFTKVTTSASSPETRKSALEGFEVIKKNGWRAWVERDDTGERIAEFEPD